MQIVTPISLPAAGGQDYAGGDVRHVTQASELAYTSISTATRNLANRDNLLADAINAVISIVNNQEQLISLPTVRTTLPAGDTGETVANYCIPVGFEARVLSAAIFSTSSQASLNVSWSPGFGSNGSGTGAVSLVDTLTSVQAGTVFYGAGELVVNLSAGLVTTDVVASVIISMRPTGVQSNGLISAGTAGPAGAPGAPGVQGVPGTPGTPGANGASIVPCGPWVGTTAYAILSLVTEFSSATSLTRNFIARCASQGVDPITDVSGAGLNWMELFAQSSD